MNRSIVFKHCGLMPRHIRQVTNQHDGWANALKTSTALLGNGSIIALVGPRGTGKTQLAAELIRTTIRESTYSAPNYTPEWTCYMTATQFFMRVKGSYDGKENEREILKDLTTPPILVIDELHERKCSEWENSLLTTLIDTRYGYERDTILISNQDRDDFVQNIGQSAADRMNEGGGIIEMNWKSFRGIK